MNDQKNPGVQVQHLFPGSVAEKCGVKIGDIILAVDGVGVSTLLEYAEQASKREGNEMVLDILRGNDLQEITLIYS